MKPEFRRMENVPIDLTTGYLVFSSLDRRRDVTATKSAHLRRLTVTLSVVALIVATLVLVFRGGPTLERVAVPSLPTEFIKFTAVPAQTGEKEYGVPTSVSIAHAILESNWAQSVLTKEGNAFFGIKCGDNNGPYAIGCLKKTTAECDMTGACHDEIASFRAYSTSAD